MDFQRKIKERKSAARDIGQYDAWGPYKWNDELLVGAPESEPEHQLEAILKDEPDRSASDEFGNEIPNPNNPEDLPRPVSRVTEADRKGDTKSLNRMLQRTLYLVVQNSENKWEFPSAPWQPKESLHYVSTITI